jgi:predicted DNA-binding transcriptional regulator AlpA
LETLLTPEQTTEALGLRSTRTLRKWRYEGRGPAYVRLGNNTIRYRKSDLEAYLAARVTSPSKEGE